MKTIALKLQRHKTTFEKVYGGHFLYLQNTRGGKIILGAKELENKSLEILGLKNPEKLINDFGDIVNNRKR